MSIVKLLKTTPNSDNSNQMTSLLPNGGTGLRFLEQHHGALEF